MRFLLPFVIILLALTLPARAQSNIFDLPGERPTRAIATISETLDESKSPTIPPPHGDMLALLTGHLATFEGRDLAQLRACQSGRPKPDQRDAFDHALPICTIHLFSAEQRKRIRIVKAPDGTLMARPIDEPGEPVTLATTVLIHPQRWAELSETWPTFRGPFTDDSPPAKSTSQPLTPLEASPITLDARTLSQRFGRRGSIRFEPAELNLKEERIVIRLPRNYSPRTPAGLLVWVHAMPDAIIPGVFTEALDQHNIIAIAAGNSGNDRAVADRFQLALDGIASASRLHHIDRERIYITGISGGGRIAGMLATCMPDIFAGAIPIVGLDAWENIPNGSGQFWPAAHARPPAPMLSLLKQRRIAPITGPLDGNYRKILGAAHILRKAGAQVRLFDYPDMGHDMPTANRFAEALDWIDVPYREKRQAASREAAAALAAYTTAAGDLAPATTEQRATLEKIMQTAPWSDPAWSAAALLFPAVAPSTRP